MGLYLQEDGDNYTAFRMSFRIYLAIFSIGI